jgi:pimeloyl-ACP methyl ester carboxylesterase
MTTCGLFSASNSARSSSEKGNVMRTRIVLITLALCIAIAAAPVLITKLFPPQPRALKGVRIEDASFEEVHFHNSIQDLDLAGMLFMPTIEGPVPAVVIIQGSGTSHRDNPWYLALATYLQGHGTAVLIPDKRGSEASQGDWHTSSFADLATDAEAAIAFLKGTYRDQIGPIGVLGASQGGQVVPIVATQTPDAAFVINLVGSVVPFHDALLYEENLNLRQAGFLPGISNVIAYVSSAYIRNIGQRDFWSAIGNYDPLPFWAEVTVPALVVFGADDTNTPTQRSAARLATLNNKNIRVVVFEGSGHPLEDPIGTGDSIFRQDALALISDFIHSATPDG